MHKMCGEFGRPHFDALIVQSRPPVPSGHSCCTIFIFCDFRTVPGDGQLTVQGRINDLFCFLTNPPPCPPGTEWRVRDRMSPQDLSLFWDPIQGGGVP